MSRLTRLDALPAPDLKRVGPHAYRRLAGKVLVTNDWGGRAFLTEEEYRRYLAGLDRKDPLWAPLQEKGFVRDALDVEAAAADMAERGLPAWRGPSTHLMFLQRGAARMSLETARRCVDFAFSAPGRALTLELAADDAEACWGVLWFCVQYARRRSEWSRRPLFLILRARALPAARVDFLRGHGVARRLIVEASGAPLLSAPAPFPAQRVLLGVGPGARDPEGWADLFLAWGVDAARLKPEGPLTAHSAATFASFYGAFLDRLIARAEERPLVEEWARAFLERLKWNLPGADVLEELAYDPGGGVFTSEAGLELAESGSAALRLGEAGTLRYEDLAGSEAVRACVSAVSADSQPLCAQCAYRPYCATAASANLAAQGSVWGNMVASPACELQMAILDLLFARLASGIFLPLFSYWNIDNS